ncbi:MAG: hypothetical protein ACYDH5_14780 [Acidimicrobiales bacterium]
MTAATQVGPPAYAELYGWAHQEQSPVDRRFAAPLFLHEYAMGDEELANRLDAPGNVTSPRSAPGSPPAWLGPPALPGDVRRFPPGPETSGMHDVCQFLGPFVSWVQHSAGQLAPGEARSWGGRAPGSHGPIGVGTCTPEGRFRAVELTEPIESGPADATYIATQPTPHQPAAVVLLQSVRGVEQALERRVAVAGRERAGRCQ